MITDIQVQHELLKTALEATDNYLFIEKRAVEAGTATNTMIHDFSYEMSRAHNALQSLGVLDQHQDYMEKHIQTMMDLHGSANQSLSDLPYTHVPGSDFGEVEESKEFWDSAKERADEPKEKLSPAWKAKARARAAAAGRKYPNMVDNVWAAQKQESVLSSFTDFLSESTSKEFSLSEDDINDIVEKLNWSDMIDLYEADELIEEDVVEQLEELEEGLSASTRLKKRLSFSRSKSKRNTAKNIKLKRASTLSVLKKRAIVAARRSMYKRLLRGRDRSSLSASEKDRIEQQVKNLKNLQSSLATRLLPKMREIEQKRLSSRNTK